MPPQGRMRAPAKPKNAKGTFRRLVSYLAPHKGKLIAVAAKKATISIGNIILSMQICNELLLRFAIKPDIKSRVTATSDHTG